MGDEDVENYVDSIVEKKLKRLGFKEKADDDSVTSAPSHLKNLVGEIKVVKELGEATRGDLDKIIADGIKQKMAEQIVPVLFSGGQQRGSFMDSGFMQQVGKGLGEKIPEYASIIIDSLTRNFGKDGAEKMIDKVMSTGAGAGVPGAGNKENEDIIGSLDPDNPNHLHYYMASRNLVGVSVEDARKSLINEKKNLMEKMKSAAHGSSGITREGEASTLENDIKEQNIYLEKLIKKQNQSDEVIKFLVDKIEKMEGGKGGIVDNGSGISIDPEDGVLNEVSGVDSTISQNLNKTWGADIERNKEKIRIENEEKERIEKDRIEKEERERVVIAGHMRRASPVFES